MADTMEPFLGINILHVFNAVEAIRDNQQSLLSDNCQKHLITNLFSQETYRFSENSQEVLQTDSEVQNHRQEI